MKQIMYNSVRGFHWCQSVILVAKEILEDTDVILDCAVLVTEFSFDVIGVTKEILSRALT